MPKQATTTTTEVETTTLYDPETLRSLDSFDAALLLAEKAHGDLALADKELGDGFALLANKDTLIGVPCLFMEWHFYPGDFGEFVSARIATKQGENGVGRYIVNDGSTGIYQQLRDYTDRYSKHGGLVSRHGLRKSEYDTNKEGVPVAKGAPDAVSKGVTYYIDTSA